MTQEQFRASESQPPSGGASATTSIEAAVHGEMSLLAKRFQNLLIDISNAGLMRQMRIKHRQGVVMGAANVYSGPSTRATQVDVARPGMIVRVYAEETGQAFPPGNLWYRISKPSAPPRYIAAGLVIRDNLHQLLQDYFQLATQVWEEAAADRLEDMAKGKFYSNGNSYNTGVDRLDKHLEKFEELRDNAKQIPHPKKGRRGQRRVWLYQRALKAWQDDCLGKDPDTMLSDPTRCGRILYRARGYLGLASCNGFDYVLIKGLQMLNVLVSLLSLFVLVWLVGLFPASLVSFLGQPAASQGNPIFMTTALSLIFLFTSAYLLWLSSMRISLPVMMGYALTRQQAPGAALTARKVHPQFLSHLQPFFRTSVSIPRKMWDMSLHPLRFWLRVWSILGGAFLLLILYFAIIVNPPSDVGAQGITLIAFEVFAFSIVYIPICFFIILPFTLTMQAQMWGELAHTQRPPKARRSAAGLAIKLLSFHTICFLAIAVAILNLVPPFNSGTLITLDSLSINPLHQVMYLLIVVLLYLLCLELPYRWGLRRWKNHRLDELATRRKEVDRRLSLALLAVAVEKELSIIQEDYIRWQYYRAQEEDVNHTSPGPFSLVQRGWALLLTLATGYLINIATGPLSSILLQITPHK